MTEVREGTFNQRSCIGRFVGLKVWECNPPLMFDECHAMVASIKDETANKDELHRQLSERGSPPVWETKSVSKSERTPVVKGKSKDELYQELYDKARQAGLAAGEALVPTPMIVGSPSTPLGNDIDPTKKTYYVPSGVCGFAWIQLPGNTSFAKWAQKKGLLSNGYPNGKTFWVSEFGQSMEQKEAYARAFANVLREAGIERVYAQSRMD